MKIAMVSEHANPMAVVGDVDAGGQNVHVGALAAALAAQGHEVVVHTRRDDRSSPERSQLCPGVTVELVEAGPPRHVPKDELLPYIPELGRRLAARWQSDLPDVVHAHFWMSGLAATLGVRGTDVPVVQTFHALGSVKRRHQGADDTSPPERVRLEAALARTVDVVVATCSDEVTELLALGADRRRIAVVPCGVDVDLFSESARPWPRSSRPRLVCIGRLVPRKGVATVIEALPRLIGAELLVAGGPARASLEGDAEARRLQELATQLGVRDRLHMLGGVARTDVPGLLRSADVAVSVPWYEPFGMTTLEAMAVGVPVVASAVGGHLDTVEAGVTGRLVPPQSPEALARAVGRLLADDVGRTAMGLTAAERARSRFGWDRVAQETLQVYTSVLARRPAAVAS